MSDPGDLLRGIREKILAGDLPKQNCRMTWYGPGTGGICVACEQPIAAHDVEVECDLPNGGTSRTKSRARSPNMAITSSRAVASLGRSMALVLAFEP